MQQERPASFTGAPSGTAAGFAIAACAVLTVVAIAHHPTTSAREPAEAITQIVHLATLDRIVHGVLIALMGVLVFAFAVFSLRRGLHRQTVLAALIAYAAGIGAIVGAGLVDGFLVSALAERYAGAGPDAVRLATTFFVFCALVIQILTKFGMIALSTGVVLWSADLVRTPGALRITGIVGIASGAAVVVVLAFAGRLNPHNLVAVVLLQAVWYVAVAVLLVRGRV